MEVTVGWGYSQAKKSHTHLPHGLGYPSSESLTCILLRCQAPVGKQKGRAPALQNPVQ